jgi:DNA adenine methylase
MPTKHDVYVEPFAGSAAVLLNKPRSLIEVYNDKDLQVLNYFVTLRNFPEELIRQIKLTPFHIDEWAFSWETDDLYVITPIELARRFYIRSFKSIMGPSTQWGNGFRRQKVYSRGNSGKSSMKPAAISFSETSHLYTIADRLRGVIFENMDAMACMLLYDSPDTLMYIDPPYLETTRQHKIDHAYAHEMLTEGVHISFLSQILEAASMSLISHYKCELYDDMLLPKGWEVFEKESRINGGGKTQEALYLNPQIIAKLEK